MKKIKFKCEDVFYNKQMNYFVVVTDLICEDEDGHFVSYYKYHSEYKLADLEFMDRKNDKYFEWLGTL